MNERVKLARKALSLNQTEFGGRLGVTPTAISKIEGGERGLTDQMILAICREFSINETWLRTGKGSMFVENDNTILADLVREYDLDGADTKILDTYIRLPADSRRVVKSFLVSLAEAVQEGTTSLEAFIDSDKSPVRVFKAAHSEDNRESQITEVPRSTIDKLKAAKDVEEI